MATTMNVRLLLVVLLIAAAATVLPRTEAAEHVVGDATGWIEPATSTFYSNWAANKTFSVSDVLVFNFVTGKHDVATVNKDDFANCNTANTLTTVTNGPANITLSTAEEKYFICTIPGHCTAGQKLAVNVTGSPSTTPSPPGVVTASPPPPSGSSASSLAATFSLILVTIASTIFYLF